jgi:hypothetical protein
MRRWKREWEWKWNIKMRWKSKMDDIGIQPVAFYMLNRRSADQTITLLLPLLSSLLTLTLFYT